MNILREMGTQDKQISLCIHTVHRDLSVPPWALIDATALYDPKLCYILDGFLAVYCLIITGMYFKEKFFRPKSKTAEDSIYTDLQGQDHGNYAPLRARDPESGRARRNNDDIYQGLTQRTEDEYKELPTKKRERQKPGDDTYQGLSKGTKETYDSVAMKRLPPR